VAVPTLALLYLMRDVRNAGPQVPVGAGQGGDGLGLES
jgi:hypothetical protein